MTTVTGISGEAFDESEVQPWTYLPDPYFWPAHGVTVIADRHLPDGTRQMKVQEAVPPGLVVCNAQIIGADS